MLPYPIVGLSLTHSTNGTLSLGALLSYWQCILVSIFTFHLGAIDSSVVQNISLMSWHVVEPFEPFPGQNASTTPLYLDWVIPLDDLIVRLIFIDL